MEHWLPGLPRLQDHELLEPRDVARAGMVDTLILAGMVDTLILAGLVDTLILVGLVVTLMRPGM
eukprot:6896910-Lingulodinium_polyedra.AAC.1